MQICLREPYAEIHTCITRLLLILHPCRFAAGASPRAHHMLSSMIYRDSHQKTPKLRCTWCFPLYSLPPTCTPGHLKPTNKGTGRKKENREKPPKNSAYKGTRRKMENREKKPKKIHHTNVQGEKREKKPKKTQHTKGERQKGNNDKPKIKLCITKLDKIKLNLY